MAVALDVYPARERAEDFPGVSGKLIAEAAADAAGGRPVYWLPTFDEALAVLGPRLRAGDLVLVMGAGDIDALGRALVRLADEQGQTISLNVHRSDNIQAYDSSDEKLLEKRAPCSSVWSGRLRVRGAGDGARRPSWGTLRHDSTS